MALATCQRSDVNETHRSGLNSLSDAHMSAEHGTAFVGRLSEYKTSRREYERHAALCSHVFNPRHQPGEHGEWRLQKSVTGRGLGCVALSNVMSFRGACSGRLARGAST
jgi:hypothetical protein